jgi:hypothetical protein
MVDLEKRAVPRIAVAFCQMHLDAFGRTLGVEDLSEKGCSLRLLDPNDAAQLSVGQVLEGELRFGAHRTRVAIRIAHWSAARIGAEWVSVDSVLNAILKEAESPEEMALVLRRLRLGPGTDEDCVAYSAPGGFDLWLMGAAKSLDDCHEALVRFRGAWLSWRKDHGYRTGKGDFIRDSVSEVNLVRFDWHSIEWLDPVDRELIDRFERVTRAASIEGPWFSNGGSKE